MYSTCNELAIHLQIFFFFFLPWALLHSSTNVEKITPMLMECWNVRATQMSEKEKWKESFIKY